MLPILLDIVILLMIVFSLIKGYKNGFFATLISLAGIFIIIPLAIIISIPLTNVVYNDFSISENIQGEVRKFVDSKVGDNEQLTQKVSNGSKEDDSKLNSSILKKIFSKSPSDYLKEGKSATKTALVEDVTKLIIRAGLILLLFILFSLILLIVKTAVGGLLDSLPLIENLNGVGGAALGLVVAAIKIFVLLYLLGLVGSFTPMFNVSEFMDKTLLTNVLYQNNPIDLIIK